MDMKPAKELEDELKEKKNAIKEMIKQVLDMFAEIREKRAKNGKTIYPEKESLYREIDLRVDGLPEEIIINIGKEFWEKVPDYLEKSKRITAIPEYFSEIRQELSNRFGLSEDLITGIINRYLKIYASQDKYDRDETPATNRENSGRIIYGRNWGDVGRALLWR